MDMNIGTTNFARIENQSDMDDLIKSLDLKSEHVIIKPNWVDGLLGSHTEARALDMLLTALDRKVTIVESYTFWRTDKTTKGEGDYFSSKEATVETGIKHWDFFREQDKLFLKVEGLDKVLEKHKTEYVNVTNEVWSQKVVKPETIKRLVEEKYSPIWFPQLYSYIPEKLFELRGCDFLSLAKAKADDGYGPSLAIKNLFGLIPDPTRAPGYHGGEGESDLSKAIIDIHKIYQSLFSTRFMIDGIFTSGFMNWEEKRFIPSMNWGIAIAGIDGLGVDSVGSKLLKRDFKGPMVGLMEQYKEVFGGNEVDEKDIPEEYKIDLKTG